MTRQSEAVIVALRTQEAAFVVTESAIVGFGACKCRDRLPRLWWV